MEPIENQAEAAEVARLWQNEAAHGEAMDSMLRSLEKRGSFSRTSWLALLATPGALSTAQVIDLYLQLRNGTWRNELEWRKEFTETFAASASSLPPPERWAIIDYWEQGLCQGIVHGNTDLVKAGLDELRSAGISLDELGRVARASLKERLWIPASENTPPENAWTFAELAAAAGKPDITALFQAEP